MGVKNFVIENNKVIQECNINKWNGYYTNLPNNPSAFLYGDTVTYEKAAQFLLDCKTVEDWGCGGGGFLRFRKDAIGVDGSDTKFAIKKFIDLKTYSSDCDGIHMRHVLEHNYAWMNILKNALNSAKEKLVITFFIPVNDKGETVEISHNKSLGVDVPDLSISEKEFLNLLKEHKPKISKVETLTLSTNTQYGKEQMFFIKK